MRGGTLAAPLARLIKLQPWEVPALGAAFAYNFLLFTAYYILRPLRDSMGIAGGVRSLDNLFWVTFLTMLAAMPLFGWLCGRYRRAVFLPWTYGFFILNLLAFWAVFHVQADDVWTARVFFVWVSVFNLFVVSVFWSFMADLFDREQAKRMFAFIAGGASTGAINPFAGALLVGRSGYLAGIGVFVFLLVTVSTFLYLQQAELLASFYPDGSERTAFLGRIDLVVNLLAVVLQLLAVGRLTARFGVAVMLPSIPLMMVAGFVLLAVQPALVTLVAVLVARRAGEYAVTRPCREMLFTTVDRETKYKAKNFIDTVVYRGGDAISASAHDAVIRAFSLGLSGIAWLGAAVAAAWVLVSVALGRRHEAMRPPAESPGG
jgi:AAA family ATP:ADP antiporter